MLRYLLALLTLQTSLSLASAQDFTYQVRKSIFSRQQYFWPDLEKSSVDKAGDRAPSANSPPVRLGVLPIRIVDYHESIPCDSCHRLSANGMEFYFENYLKDKLAERFPKAQVELIAPQFSLLENQKLDLLAYLDSLDLPWARWFDDAGETPGGETRGGEALIYRPRDRMTPSATRKRLDRLGGLLHQDYLLLPTKVDIRVTPLVSNAHTGGFKWRFALVFWNVAEGRPEWSMLYSGKAALMDLDKSLDAHLDKALGAAWDGLPGELTALWHAEPR